MSIRELTKAEMEIMRIIWANDNIFLADIYAAIDEPRPAYTTVSTVVRTLVNKGFLKFQSYGKSNCYSAAITKREYSTSAIEQMQYDLFDGSYSDMLSFFAKKESINQKQRDELIAMLSDEKKEE